MADTRRPVRPRHVTSPTAVDLLRRAQNGDRAAFGLLYTEHLDLATRYVTVRLRDRDRDCDTIPDVVHDAFADALAELASAPQDVTGWLLQLAARACTRHRWATRRYLRAAREIGEQAATTPAGPPAARPVAPGPSTVIQAGMAQLTDNQRTAIQLRYLDGCPRDLAAVVMRRSTQAVRDLERRGLRHLHATLTLPAAGTAPRQASGRPQPGAVHGEA